MSATIPYPAQLDFRGEQQVARWRPLVQWLLAVPQLLVVSALRLLRFVLTLIAFFAVVFTQRIPRPLFDAIAMTHRYGWRVTSYALFLREAYPPFDFQPNAADDGVDPHTLVSLTYPEQMSRWLPLVKWLLAVPHYLALFVLGIAEIVVVIAAFFAVLVTGGYPQGLREFLVGVHRYDVRVRAYVGLITDHYPPFTMAE